ncbi:unnamed protein product [Closterium sp. NIES-64]|nr:unnamed protein product [Closterium sp. NIES-64]
MATTSRVLSTQSASPLLSRSTLGRQRATASVAPCNAGSESGVRRRIQAGLARISGVRITPVRTPARGRSAPSAEGARKRGGLLVVRAVGDHQLAPLPYQLDALEPHVSRSALEAHWSGHHGRQLAALNRQLDADLALKRLPLEELVKVAYNGGNPLPCFNLAAEAWNHEFFFSGLQPADEAEGREGGNRPEGEVLRLVERDFGSVEGFQREFRQACALSFGSGYVWLSAKVDTVVPEEWLADMRVPNTYRLQVAHLRVERTVNAFNPLVFDRIPLTVLDLWEHSYLSDYPDNRSAYVEAFLQQLMSWDAVAARVDRAKSLTNFWEMPAPPDAFIRPGFVADRPIPLDALKSIK